MLALGMAKGKREWRPSMTLWIISQVIRDLGGQRSVYWRTPKNKGVRRLRQIGGLTSTPYVGKEVEPNGLRPGARGHGPVLSTELGSGVHTGTSLNPLESVKTKRLRHLVMGTKKNTERI